MLLTHYTLAALARAWDEALAGATVAEAYSQHRDELAIGVEHGDDASTLVFVARPGLRTLFRNAGLGRARRNTASLFEAAEGRRVTAVRLAERDRVLFLDLGDGLAFTVALFGPRPNVWLTHHGDPVEALDASNPEPPTPRAAPEVTTFEAFATRWPAKGTTARAVARALPLFDATLAAETLHRAGVQTENAADCTDADRLALFEAGRTLDAEMARPRPVVYWRGARAEAFGLVPLGHLADLRAESFDRLDDAVRVFSHRLLGQERFDARYRPLAQRLETVAARLARSAERMMEELAQPSRADGYERFGHLLMAQATDLPPGHDAIELPDILGDGEPVAIPLDTARTGIENAERYYAKARRTRAARAHAEARWEDAHARAEHAAALLDGLHATERLPELDAFLSEHGDAVEAFLGSASGEEERLPYRRFPLPGGLEAWVGKNARANAELTTRHARPFDLWLHARGVPGSHVVVRRPSRDAVIGREAVEAAARLAARYSEARTSALVPVQVTERKHVRPVKGGAPGLVRVEREEVLLVEPAER